MKLRKQLNEFSKGLRLLANVSLGTRKWSFWTGSFLLIILSLNSALTASTPIFFKFAIDSSLAHNATENGAQLFLILSLFCAAQIGIRILSELRWKYLGIIESNAQKNLAAHIFSSLFSARYDHFEKKKLGEYVALGEKAKSSLRTCLVNLLLNIFPLLTDIIMYLCISIYFFDGLALPYMLLPLIIYLSFLFVGSEWFYRYQKAARLQENSVAKSLAENLANYDSIKMFYSEDAQLQKHIGILDDTLVVSKRAWSMRSRIGIYQNVLLSLAVCSTTIISMIRFNNSEISLGSVALVVLLFFQIIRPLEGISFIYRETKQALLDLVILDDHLPRKVDIAPVYPSDYTTHSDSSIEFRNVSFWYPDGTQALEDVSFTMPLNTILGITGPSGSGKSTILRLMLGLYDCQIGEIFINGLRIKDLKGSELKHLISIVPQEISLFNSTVKHNISCFKQSSPDEEIYEAARKSLLHDLVHGLPLKYDTLIGENGFDLSGGQKQRIGIARALLNDTPITVFDEATASLDSPCESAVLAGIYRRSPKNNFVIVSHNLLNLRKADSILVLDQGRVVGFSKHENLIYQDNSIYKALWEGFETTDKRVNER